MSETTQQSVAQKTFTPRGPRPAGASTGARRPGGRSSDSRPGRTGGASRGKSDRGTRGSFEKPKPEFEQKTLSIRRVTRVVSGGRRFSFSVVLAIGDRKGSIGLGVGKAGDTSLAIQKAFNDAKKNMIRIQLSETLSIPHEVDAKYSSAKVFLMPNAGRGVVVGSAMRVMVELAGIHNITGRVMSGSKNKLNIAAATIKALSVFASPKKVEAKPVAFVDSE